MRHEFEDETEDESKEVCQLLVENLTSGMQGSAMWARMTLEDLVTAGLTSPDSIRYYLKENELPRPLTELYLRVFKNMTGGNDTSKWLLGRSLELIAGARQRLTFDELLYALSLYNPPSLRRVSRAAKNLAELRETLDSQIDQKRVRKLLRPFADLKPRVGFVHESLKYAVLHEFPVLIDAAPPRQQGWTGVSGIEGVMLRTCVDYLMLDDFISIERSKYSKTFPDDKFMALIELLSLYGQYDIIETFRCNKVTPIEMDERCSTSSENSATEPPVSPKTDPFGFFFDYAARCLKFHPGGAPVDFNLDDVLELASPTSARNKAWRLGSNSVIYSNCSPAMKPGPLCLIAGFGNVPMLEQQLDRLPQNSDGDRRLIVAAATTAIFYENSGIFQTLMNHRSTAMAMQTVEVLEILMAQLPGNLAFPRSDHLTELTRLIRDLVDTLAPDTIPLPNELLSKACGRGWKCMPVIEKLCERAKADPAFQKKLLQPTDGIGPLGKLAKNGDVATLHYLCQQDGIEAHAANRDKEGREHPGHGQPPHPHNRDDRTAPQQIPVAGERARRR